MRYLGTFRSLRMTAVSRDVLNRFVTKHPISAIYIFNFDRVVPRKQFSYLPEAGVLVRKFSQLTRLNYAKRAKANHRYFILLCGINCELAGCVHRPIVDSECTIAG
jgi:hypothetical protein